MILDLPRRFDADVRGPRAADRDVAPDPRVPRAAEPFALVIRRSHDVPAPGLRAAAARLGASDAVSAANGRGPTWHGPTGLPLTNEARLPPVQTCTSPSVGARVPIPYRSCIPSRFDAPADPGRTPSQRRSTPWRRHPVLLACGAVVLLTAAGCAAPQKGAEWPPTAKKWVERAEASYRDGDIEDADEAASNALRLLPTEERVRLLAARVALAKLEYDRVSTLLEGLRSADAAGLRGRALWYSGSMVRAAEELERLLADPEVRDPWASEVVKLARRGAGREPFRMSGGLLAVSDMPRVRGSAMVVPLEVDGEPALAMIATATAEVVIDSSKGNEPKWVSLRFGEKVEVHDVPALAKDLSGISRQLEAPIKMLIGVNLLRHVHPTIDYVGDQFVVRTFEPPPPPEATTLPVHYVRGGGMLIRTALGTDESSPRLSLLVDTSLGLPVALDSDGWKRAGMDPSTLEPVPNAAQLRQGVLPLLRVGAFDLPKVPAYYGAPIKEVENTVGINLSGFVGAELIEAFRVTLAEGGRSLWLENLPRELTEAPAALPPADEMLPLPDASQGAPPGGPAPQLEAPTQPALPSK
jgi:hypothetical protein